MLRKFWRAVLKNTEDGSSRVPNFESLLPVDYDPLSLPCQGNPLDLSVAQVDQNEQYLRSVIDARVAKLKQLLREEGIVWPDDLTNADYESLTQATREWAKRTWPALRGSASSDDVYKCWWYGVRDGRYLGLSVVSDVSFLLGQLIIANRSSLQWGMDRSALNKEDGMTTANRWVLHGTWLPDPSETVYVDVEATVKTLFVFPNDSSERLFNTWAQLVDDCISGGHEGAALIGSSSFDT